MAERRTLKEGVKPTDIDPDLAQRFIKGDFPASKKQPPAAAAERPKITVPSVDEPKPALLNGGGRVPLTVRVRPEFATAVKRASLERQLRGIEPSSQQDILEEALEPWLRTNGYLS
jgi:hypothetical protein